MNEFNSQLVIDNGTLEEIKKSVAYIIYNDIYLSLMGHFECADKEAKDFLSECILRNLLSTEVTMSGRCYDQTLGSIMYEEYTIATDGNKFYLFGEDEFDEGDEDLRKYELSDDDLKDISKEIQNIKKMEEE